MSLSPSVGVSHYIVCYRKTHSHTSTNYASYNCLRKISTPTESTPLDAGYYGILITTLSTVTKHIDLDYGRM